MKKVITILTILVVLVGAVFAASESHTIRVKADVSEVVPVFQFKFDTYKTNNTNNGTEFTNNASYAAQADVNAIDAGFNLDESGTLTAYAVVANEAKSLKAYTIEFGGGTFTVNRAGVSGPYAPTTITSAVGTTPMTGVATIALGADATDGQPATPEEGPAPATTNKKVVVTFNGSTMVSGEKTVASADYYYAGDTTIDPLATGNYYYANITMTVTTP